MFLSTKIYCLLVIIVIQEQVTLATISNSNSTVKKDDNGGKLSKSSSIEIKVVGPLRVWHVVFLSCVFVLIIVVILCCCFDVRIPRTRQEIEERYQKRIENSKFVKYLDKLPDNAVKLRLDHKAKTSLEEEDDMQTENVPKVKVTKSGNLAVATPLAGHPTKALAELAKRKHFGEPKARPGQKAMAESMQSVPKPQITSKTRQTSKNQS